MQELLRTDPWETHEILYALDRIPRTLWPYDDVARVHLSLSGTLLEALSDPRFQNEVYGVVDCGSLLWHFQNTRIFNILGTGYYHPVLPLIPEADRQEHVGRWKGIAGHVFWRREFQGFWPPEMAFCMEMIPLLKRHGYRYVLVDSNHVQPVDEMSWHELRYRPHIARHGGEEIIVIVRDRDLSNAQQSGMELGWFTQELESRTQYCDFEPLVTTATDGDNGGWFRNPNPEASFWGLYTQMLEQSRRNEIAIRPTFIDDYLDRFGAHGEVRVDTGAWNTGWHHGHGFLQWTGSQAQKDGFARAAQLSKEIHDLRWRVGELHIQDPEIHGKVEAALWHLLRAETSCNFYWGEAWVPRAHADMDTSWRLLEETRQRVDPTPRADA